MFTEKRLRNIKDRKKGSCSQGGTVEEIKLLRGTEQLDEEYLQEKNSNQKISEN